MLCGVICHLPLPDAVRASRAGSCASVHSQYDSWPMDRRADERRDLGYSHPPCARVACRSRITSQQRVWATCTHPRVLVPCPSVGAAAPVPGPSVCRPRKRRFWGLGARIMQRDQPRPRSSPPTPPPLLARATPCVDSHFPLSIQPRPLPSARAHSSPVPFHLIDRPITRRRSRPQSAPLASPPRPSALRTLPSPVARHTRQPSILAAALPPSPEKPSAPARAPPRMPNRDPPPFLSPSPACASGRGDLLVCAGMRRAA